MGRRVGVYAMYKGDDFIDLGTLSELAKKYQFKRSTLESHSTKQYRQHHKDGMILIRIGDEQNDI